MGSFAHPSQLQVVISNDSFSSPLCLCDILRIATGGFTIPAQIALAKAAAEAVRTHCLPQRSSRARRLRSQLLRHCHDSQHTHTRRLEERAADKRDKSRGGELESGRSARLLDSDADWGDRFCSASLCLLGRAEWGNNDVAARPRLFAQTNLTHLRSLMQADRWLEIICIN